MFPGMTILIENTPELFGIAIPAPSPVEPIQFNLGCIVRKSTISEPFLVTQLIRPFGKPARVKAMHHMKSRYSTLGRRLEHG